MKLKNIRIVFSIHTTNQSHYLLIQNFIKSFKLPWYEPRSNPICNDRLPEEYWHSFPEEHHIIIGLNDLDKCKLLVKKIINHTNKKRKWIYVAIFPKDVFDIPLWHSLKNPRIYEESIDFWSPTFDPKNEIFTKNQWFNYLQEIDTKMIKTELGGIQCEEVECGEKWFLKN